MKAGIQGLLLANHRRTIGACCNALLPRKISPHESSKRGYNDSERSLPIDA